MMTSYDALFPGDEIQLLIDTYLPSDDQYYPDDLVVGSKPYPETHKHSKHTFQVELLNIICNLS